MPTNKYYSLLMLEMEANVFPHYAQAHPKAFPQMWMHWHILSTSFMKFFDGWCLPVRKNSARASRSAVASIMLVGSPDIPLESTYVKAFYKSMYNAFEAIVLQFMKDHLPQGPNLLARINQEASLCDDPITWSLKNGTTTGEWVPSVVIPVPPQIAHAQPPTKRFTMPPKSTGAIDSRSPQLKQTQLERSRSMPVIPIQPTNARDSSSPTPSGESKERGMFRSKRMRNVARSATQGK
jgi:hypothetical protein